ncbi:MAG TPA: response regulator [Candidatus Ozemobacteraceae bacterium]|nr:response regulator [Candidatus Ozemobacteraceae bacterium]
MAQRIKVFIADDMIELRSNVRRMLSTLDNVRVVGEAGDGDEALKLIRELSPHVVLMDINMPKLDGLKATETLTKERPNIQVIIMSIQSEQEYFRRAMKAGAKDFLTKPFSGSELSEAILNVFNQWVKDTPDALVEEQKAQVLTFFSTKGGVGKTTLATNLAVSLARLGKHTLLIDTSLQFGDVAITLNQKCNRNIYGIIQDNKDEVSPEDIEKNTVRHPSGLELLLAPIEPAYAESIKAQHIKQILDHVSENYQFIIFDTAPHIGDLELAILDRTDLVLLVATLEISSLKNTKLCLKTFSDIKFDTNKIKLVLNKDFPHAGIGCKDIEAGLAIPLFSTVPMDMATAQQALNQGEPFVVKSPDTPLAKTIKDMAMTIAGVEREAPAEEQESVIDKFKNILLRVLNQGR